QEIHCDERDIRELNSLAWEMERRMVQVKQAPAQEKDERVEDLAATTEGLLPGSAPEQAGSTDLEPAVPKTEETQKQGQAPKAFDQERESQFESEAEVSEPPQPGAETTSGQGPANAGEPQGEAKRKLLHKLVSGMVRAYVWDNGPGKEPTFTHGRS